MLYTVSCYIWVVETVCGIAGLCNFDQTPVDRDILRSMNKCMAHRGPDAFGELIIGNVGIANRRLSIIDLSDSANQPIEDKGSRVSITYNGEIYNFLELRNELASKGYKFTTDSDTEVVLKSYLEWGEKCVNKFNGMFGFAIYDPRINILFLARDRYGVKPLYYWYNDKKFAFGSEIKTITTLPDFKVKLDRLAFHQYFTFQNILDDRTLFEGVRLLPQGNFIVLKTSGTDHPAPTLYWDADFHGDQNLKDEREIEEELHRVFETAVSRQLISDVSVATFLSGGIDSGSVTSVASREIPGISTFTAGFDVSDTTREESHFDERVNARTLASLFETNHSEILINHLHMQECMEDLVWHLEDLRVGQSYPNYQLYRYVSKKCKVVLSGTGGDELFAGYPWRYKNAYVSKNDEEYVEKYQNYWKRLLPNVPSSTIFVDDFHFKYDDDYIHSVFNKSFNPYGAEMKSVPDFINQSLYFEFKNFLHGLLLVDDKLSMAHSLEIRVPFLDNDLVDFALRIPVEMKLSTGTILGDGSRSNTGKQVLRRVLKNYMPEGYTKLTKQGFSGPDATWFRRESLQFIEELLLSKDSRIIDYIQKEFILNIIEQHKSASHNHRLLIWSLMSFEFWIRNFQE